MLVPGLNYQFETLVESMSEMGIADQIRFSDPSYYKLKKKIETYLRKYVVSMNGKR